MASTSLKRKALRNRVKSRVRKENLKLQSTSPVLKNIDVEAIKAEWAKKGGDAPAAAPAKEEAATEETK